MGIKQYKILGLCLFILSICFVVPIAADVEEYALFARGPVVEGVIEEIDNRDTGSVLVTVRYPSDGEATVGIFSTTPADDIVEGATVHLALHANVKRPMLARDVSPTMISLMPLLGSLVCALLGYCLAVRLPRKRGAQLAVRLQLAKAGDALSVLRFNVAKTARAMLVAGGLLLLLTASGVFLLADDAATSGDVRGGLVLLALFGGVSLLLLVQGWKVSRGDGHWVMRTVLHVPDRLVWAYEHIMENESLPGVKTHAVALGFEDGRMFQVLCEGAEVAVMLDYAAMISPRCVVGFRPEWEAAFRRSPEDLRAAAVAREGPPVSCS